MGSDPIKGAAGACFVVATFSVLAAMVIGAIGMVPLWAAGLCVLEGLVYAGLGVGILRESRACAWIAAALYTMSTALLLKSGLMGGLFLRGLITLQLWRAAFQIEDLSAADAKAEARRAGLDRPQARGPVPVARPVFTGPRPVLAAPATSTAVVETRRPTGRPMRGVRLCMSCRSEHPASTIRCPLCKRTLFDA